MTTTNVPAIQLPTNRGLLKLFLLGFITFGIYPIVVYSKISEEINLIATSHDGKRTTHYCLMCFVFSWLTFGIAPFIWFHNICNRIGTEIKRRGINYSFNAVDFWLWSIVGSLFVVGPFIFLYKWIKAMNLLNEDYNQKG